MTERFYIVEGNATNKSISWRPGLEPVTFRTIQVRFQQSNRLIHERTVDYLLHCSMCSCVYLNYFSVSHGARDGGFKFSLIIIYWFKLSIRFVLHDHAKYLIKWLKLLLPDATTLMSINSLAQNHLLKKSQVFMGYINIFNILYQRKCMNKCSKHIGLQKLRRSYV